MNFHQQIADRLIRHLPERNGQNFVGDQFLASAYLPSKISLRTSGSASFASGLTGSYGPPAQRVSSFRPKSLRQRRRRPSRRAGRCPAAALLRILRGFAIPKRQRALGAAAEPTKRVVGDVVVDGGSAAQAAAVTMMTTRTAARLRLDMVVVYRIVRVEHHAFASRVRRIASHKLRIATADFERIRSSVGSSTGKRSARRTARTRPCVSVNVSSAGSSVSSASSRTARMPRYGIWPRLRSRARRRSPYPRRRPRCSKQLSLVVGGSDDAIGG